MTMQYVWMQEPEQPAVEAERAFAAASAADKAAMAAAAEGGVPQALELLTRAAVRGNPAAQLWMGARYEGGKGVPRDYEAAVVWYRKAAAAGDNTAREGLARLYEQGLGVPQDKAAALALRRTGTSQAK
ncbi:sel1 repeat family protein [Pseudoduganella lutea]|uniref:Sel1 repeat family protein n=2 Tax=Pseudoduganella lutea TaxID=321985 RepID=A0A4P6L681_9BURK|nr:sel1 repeat family protein [Pseudoduganella lutea]